MHKMESVQRKKKKKKKREETVKGAQEKKMRKKKMRSHQQISWLCCKTKEDLIFRVGNWDCRTGRGWTFEERRNDEREKERQRETYGESEKNLCLIVVYFFFLIIIILLTIGLPLYHVSLILFKMGENRR